MIVRTIRITGGRTRSRTVLGLAVASLILTGCAGARYRISADRLRYPASLSPVLPDEEGRPAYLGESLKPVGRFSFNRTSVGFVYGVTGTAIDLSDDLNREVERRQGEGIVQLSLRPENCASSWFFPFTLLPFYPGCHNLTVTGTVIVRNREGRESGRGAP